MAVIQDGSAKFEVHDKRMKAIVDLIYPVGSVVAIADNSTPKFMSYGMWEKVGSGRVLWGADSSYSAGTTIEAGLPEIAGNMGGASYINSIIPPNTNNPSATGAFSARITTNVPYATITGPGTGPVNSVIGFSAKRYNAIYGNSNTVQPPAYVVNFWRRTA